MGDLTGTQLINELMLTVGRKSTDLLSDGSTTLGTLALRWLNYTQIRIANAFSFPECDVLVTNAATVASTKSYTDNTLMGATYGPRLKQYLSMRLIDTTNNNSRKLSYRHYRKFDQDIPRPEQFSNSVPVEYVHFSTTTELNPIPDAIYTLYIRASIYPTALAAGTTSDFLRKDHLIVSGSAVHFYNQIKQPKDAERWDKIFRSQMTEIVAPLISKDDFEPEGRAFESADLPPANYWADPFVRNNP